MKDTILNHLIISAKFTLSNVNACKKKILFCKAVFLSLGSYCKQFDSDVITKIHFFHQIQARKGFYELWKVFF